MNYDIKKLSEVEALTEVPEGANMIAEVGGQIKRVPAVTGEGGGSGGGQLIVELTPIEGHFSFTERFYTGNKTRYEILNAIIAEGKTVYLSAPYTVDLNTGSIVKQNGLYAFAGMSNADPCFVRIEPDSRTVKGYYLDAITFDGDTFYSESDLSYAANH